MPAKKGSVEALYKAVCAKDVAKVRALIASGADPNEQSKNYDERTIDIAVRPPGNDELGVALVEGGATATHTDQYGFTPLHYAAHLGRVRTVAALLRAGADPNAKSTAASPSFEKMSKGATPLKVASNPAIKKLLEAAVKAAGATAGGAKATAASPFAKKLEQLRDWRSNDLDFEGGEPEVDALLGFDAGAYFAALGQTGDGSVFAIWSPKGGADEPKDGAVVFLDSEGAVNSAVAGSLDEFLSLLAYGTGWIRAAAAGKPPTATKARGDIKKTFGVAPATDPSSLAATARASKPSLKDWLKKQTK
jgi:hypothetical protein